MALLIEDGSGVSGADSYVTVDQIKAYAAKFGEELPPDDADIEILARLGFQYVDSKNYMGRKTHADPARQTAAWPRTGVVVDDWLFPGDVIPQDIRDAQCQAAIEAQSTDLNPNPTAAVKREKVDVLEVEYVEGTAVAEVYFPKVDDKLAKYTGTGSAYRIRTVRG